MFLDPSEISFPDPALYDFEDGLVAVGGDLSAERLWFAYQLGIFPWYNPGEDILWWCPDPRFVLLPKELKISTSMKKIFAKKKFRFTENQCFTQVMQQCALANRKDQQGTWITAEMIESYSVLHYYGKAKSIEVWEEDQLVGGLYGVEVGQVFCGESMFSLVSNASKAGFIWFVSKYRNTYQIIDCQIETNHLGSLGAKPMSKNKFLSYLKQDYNESY